MQNIAVKSIILLFDLNETPQAAQLPAGVMILLPQQSREILPLISAMLDQTDQVVSETTLASAFQAVSYESVDTFVAEPTN